MLQSTYLRLRNPNLNKTLNIIQANRLYLATMLLVISIGTFIQGLSFSIGLLLTELVIIFLPTLWMLRHNQVDLKKSTGLSKIRASLVLVATMLGAGAWLVTSLVEQLMVQLTGYIPPTTEGVLPTSIIPAVLIFIGFVVAAPVCEELLFRGSIQSAYQNQTTTKISIWIPSLLFALYHFRLQGLPALLIISLLLGYTYWRTKSLTFTIILHAANNFLATIVLIRAGLFPTLELPFPSLQASAFGILLLVVGLVLLQRLLPHTDLQTVQQNQPVKVFTWKVLWPIFLAAILYLVMAFQEVSLGRNQNILQLNGDKLPAAAKWTYEIQHKGGEAIGMSICDWHLSASSANLSCQQEHSAFEIQIGNSFFSSLALESRMTVAWQTDNLDLINLYQEKNGEQYQSSWVINTTEDELTIDINSQGGPAEPLTISEKPLIQEEWAWRLMGLSFDPLRSYQIEYLTPLTWREDTKDNGPSIKQERLVVSGPETLQVPAGSFQAWKVALSNGETAWYSVETPHILLRFDSNMVNYLLEKTE